MGEMFCNQCEQTVGCMGCTGSKGVCGKTSVTAALQDKLIGALIGLARAQDGNEDLVTDMCNKLVLESLFATLTNVNFSDEAILNLIDAVHSQKVALVSMCGNCVNPCSRNDDFNMNTLWLEDEDIKSLKSLILYGIKGIAAYAYHASILGFNDSRIYDFLYRALFAIGVNTNETKDLLPIVLEVGEINLHAMELLDKANVSTFGVPSPVEVSRNIEPGPFVVVSGHDLYALKNILEQSENTGVNVYTHGELLPAHAYPQLNKYAHLKGNYGSAWQNQELEFDWLPAPIVFTTNCLMPPKDTYANSVYTTEVVGYPGIVHIGDFDFHQVIEKSKELGGYSEEEIQSRGLEQPLMTGFGRDAVLAVADQVVEAINSGALKQIFLVGGCDGARQSRSYYREFVEQTPTDSIVLTLACGKYRFNDLDLGSIGGLPRLLDMGQCNDAYSAIKVAIALAEIYDCNVNDLPLSMVLSWYEQKAVSILLTLLYLGIKNIKLGPTLPAFISPNILNYLVENFNISLISEPEQDIEELLNQ